jgi:hypothetical protein
MCCILCEEPVRSITFGLAALGVVTLVNGARKMIAKRAESSAAASEASDTTAPAVISADSPS